MMHTACRHLYTNGFHPKHLYSLQAAGNVQNCVFTVSAHKQTQKYDWPVFPFLQPYITSSFLLVICLLSCTACLTGYLVH